MDQDETTKPVSEVKTDIEEDDDEEMPMTTTTPTQPAEENAEEKDNMSKIDEIINTVRSIINPETGEFEMIDFEQEEGEKIVKRIGRAELEDIIRKKIPEAVNAHTVVWEWRAKCLHLHGLNEKLFLKSGVLDKQVTELSKALQVYQENANRSLSQQKPPPPLKFYRSVGLQVNDETSTTRSPMPRVNNTPRMTNSNATAFMQQISNGPLSSTTSNTSSPNNTTQEIPASFTMPSLPAPTTPLAMVQQRTKPTKEKPPQPELTLEEQDGRIVLSWIHKTDQSHAEISSYQIFMCQQPLNSNGNVIVGIWERLRDHSKVLPLPMACTLRQFSDDKTRYHFIVRGLDVYNRSGAFSELVSIVLRKKC